MCGICGIWYFDAQRQVDEHVLRTMTGTLAHRGPDEDGFYRNGSIGFGVRRLDIIDQSGSHQPLVNEDGSLVLVGNGEVYNFRSLRNELKTHHQLQTDGDLETILHLYEDCSLRCVDPLRGMFAFALWDGRADQLVMAVDRFGKKPLYYSLDSEKIVFASELKALLRYSGISREMDYEALNEYFSCGYISAPCSIFKQIRRLPAAHTMTIQRQGAVQIERYWEPIFAEPPAYDKRSPADLADQLLDLLREAVRLRLVADVPIGAFLSGGVDSTAVVALMKSLDVNPLKTFSIGFDEAAYDEGAFAGAAADFFSAEHMSAIVRPGDVLDLLPMLVRHYDEPFADSSMIPTYLVSRLAREQVTVVLSGDGGDEVFGGYHQYLYGYRQQYLEAYIPSWLQPAAVASSRVLPRTVKPKPYLAALGKPVANWLQNGYFSAAGRKALYNADLADKLNRSEGADIRRETFLRAARFDGLSQLQYHDLTVYLPGDILTKVDRASMLASLEVRCPLLDHRVFEFMARVPPRGKVNLVGGKTLLKKALAPLLPPFVARRKKQGFSIPQGEWLRGALQPLLREVLLKPSELFSQDYVVKLVEEHTAGIQDHRDRLWALLCFGLWQDQGS